MNKKVLLIILIVLTISLIGVIVFWPKSKSDEVKIINEIEGYGYILEDDETTLHKRYFDELVDVLKNDKVKEEDYALLVVKLFISDFYNLDNKITKNDVGGLQYIYGPAKDNMAFRAKDTIYKYIESNLYKDRKQELPIVSDITTDDVNIVDFEYGDKTEEAYEIKATWGYKKDLGYQTEATFTLIHEDNKLSIIEIK